MRNHFLGTFFVLIAAAFFISCAPKSSIEQASLSTPITPTPVSSVFKYRDSDYVHGTSGIRVVMYMSVCGGINVNKTKAVMDSFAKKGYLQYALREIQGEFACPGPANVKDRYSPLKTYIACMQKTSPQSYEQYLLDLLNYFNTHHENHDTSDYERVLSGYIPEQFKKHVEACLTHKDYVAILQQNTEEEMRLNGGKVINSVPVELFPDSPQLPITDDPLYFNSANTVGGILTEKDGKELLSRFVTFPN